MHFESLLWWMLYKKLTERYRSDELKLSLVNWFQVHSILILACYWILPAGLITLCCLISLGCGYSATRPYMEQWELCSSIKDFGSFSPWYLDLWNTQASNPKPEPPSPYIRAILVSPFLLEDAQVALFHYTREMQYLSPRLIEEEGLTISLSKSHVFEYLVRSLRWIRSNYQGYLKPHESSSHLCFRVMYGERFHGHGAAYFRRRITDDHQGGPNACGSGKIHVESVGASVETLEPTVAKPLVP